MARVVKKPVVDGRLELTDQAQIRAGQHNRARDSCVYNTRVQERYLYSV